MKLSNQNICNLRGFQMPLGGANNFWGGAHPPAPPQKIRAWCKRITIALAQARQKIV